ncbi:glycoside hydrolase family 16 protein, partial [Aureimonas sp. ME7]|uniref:glycoside hydrolase family 16 protein n=1 Tax=Aureimonas sp. ME7 TaxID=2744252 RepID=UPI0015FDACCE
HDGAGGRTHDVHAELQYYMEEGHGGYGVNPFKVENGVLTIHGAKADPTVASGTGYDYTSGMLSSRGEFSQQYGYFEIRAEVPAQTGTWPAFWLLPAHGEGGAELDVFEQIGSNAGKVYTTMHTSSSGVRTDSGISSWVGDAGAGMHTYGLLWTKTELVWYVDGAEVYRLATPADMHQPMYMVTNLAIGG